MELFTDREKVMSGNNSRKIWDSGPADEDVKMSVKAWKGEAAFFLVILVKSKSHDDQYGAGLQKKVTRPSFLSFY